MGLQTNSVYLKNIFKKLKKFAFLAKISNFGFDAQSIPVVIERSRFYTNVFSSIQTFLKRLEKFCKQKHIFEPPYCTCTLLENYCLTLIEKKTVKN